MYGDILILPSDSIDIEKEAYELKMLVNNMCYASTESFKNIMLSIYSKIMGLIGGIALQFKKITRLFNTLKQTELEEFSYKNGVFLNRLKKVNYNSLRNIKIPYPEGMSSSYFETTSKIVVCLNAFNMLDKSKSFLDICGSIINSILYKKLKKDIPGLQEQVSDVENIKKLFSDYTKCYTTKKIEKEKPFGKLFLNMQEYISVKDLLEKNDKYQFQVKTIYRNVEDCNDIMKYGIKAIESEKDVQDSITKEDLLSISNACMFFAKTIDMYGTTIMDFHSVEHNIVEMWKELKRKRIIGI